MNLGDLRSDTVEVYHVTPDENLPAIKTGGLIPQIGPNSAEIGETENAVHVFLSKEALEDAMMNWDSMTWHGDEEPELSLITLRVPREMLSVSNKGLSLGRGISEIHQRIPPDMIIDISEIY